MLYEFFITVDFWLPASFVTGATIMIVLAYYLSFNQAVRVAAFSIFSGPGALQKPAAAQTTFKQVSVEGFEHLDGKIDLANFDVNEIASNPVARGSLWARGAKRGFDMIVSVALLVFAAPLLVATAFAIKADTPGPVLYKQKRVGRAGRLFTIYKFRSMTVDAECGGAQWAMQNDARVTRIGRIIRKMRIDEIPQALNILMGQMSFVGPRPERPEFTAMLETEIAHYHQRHTVKPGLTGWAQVNYSYGASVEDAREKLMYDLYYIKHFSFALDLIIIIRTAKVAVFGIGSR